MSVSEPVVGSRDYAELCAKCGFTFWNHISNTGTVHPCWKPSGKFSEDKSINHPTPHVTPPPVSESTEPSEEMAKRIAARAVQTLADSEPTDDTIEAQERLAGSPQAGLFCVDATTLSHVIATTISNSFFDGEISAASVQPSVTDGIEGILRHYDAAQWELHMAEGPRIASAKETVQSLRSSLLRAFEGLREDNAKLRGTLNLEGMPEAIEAAARLAGASRTGEQK